ncbi:hypothetical protein [Sphingobium yanoikuyae]|mgnify:CR=1 FL=1|jgi:hypothetical protein|uniref:hypothetical protein n=1 Tax=Sphingobium yanoikuyae TaxID=13690 RepID=UPI0035C7BA2C
MTIFATLAEADEFHDARLTQGWATAADDMRAALLIRASDYIVDRYVGALSKDDEVDPLAKRAAIVLAAALLTAQAVDPTVTESSQELAGVGRVTTKRDLDRDPYPQITAILAPIAALRSNNASARIASSSRMAR